MAANITDPIFSFAEQHPEAEAILDGEKVISFGSLCRGVRLAANRFHEADWKPGDVVGISIRQNQVLHLIASLALARSGITQVSLPPGDPAPLMRSRIGKLGVTGLVADHDLAGNSAIACVVPDPDWQAVSPTPMPADLRVSGGDLVWMIGESSGTTAEPKLMAITHAIDDTRARIRAPALAHLPGERFVTMTGLRFLIAIRLAIHCLREGGAVAFPPAGLGPDALLRWFDSHRVGYVFCVPMHLHQLLRDMRPDNPGLPSLRILRVSTSVLTLSTLTEVRRRISRNVYNAYGTNEAGLLIVATPDMLVRHPDTIGLPQTGVDLEIVDAQGRPAPAGALGRIRARGPGVELSYLDTGEKAAHSHTFSDGWFYTGDVGVRNEAGLVFLKGRADDVMNFDGMMIGPGEIESVLREHPAVTDVAAFSLPSLEHQDIPAAAIVSPQPLQTDELSRFCQQRLGIRTPRVFLRVAEIPKNAMGKILRRQLTELALAELKKKN